MESNAIWLITGDRELPTFAWLEPDANAGDIVLNDVDDVLLGLFIMSNEAEIICIGNSDDMIGSLKFSVKLVFHVIQMLEHRIKDHKESCRTQRITLKKIHGGNKIDLISSSLTVGIELGELCDNVIMKEVFNRPGVAGAVL